METEACGMCAYQPPQYRDRPATGMNRALAQRRDEQLVGLAVKDEQQVVHVLLVIAVLGAAFLRAMHLAVGAVQIHQRLRQLVAGAGVDRVLQSGERQLTGQIGLRLGSAPQTSLSSEWEHSVVASF